MSWPVFRDWDAPRWTGDINNDLEDMLALLV
jgi:hypothetical protein